ncbi:DUF898 domain-containing protein [Pelagivirga sediminicola]|uniref:DUF898 domain-containing protein n=1 Tax=Pelagivirga sediminicola TaxID=2170575 RepID=A0A2T7G931_9RHOB|nr:DUF898 family protein [Pelagivirga sediminicola]PVA10930.1 DUF898 domain-containing protein [Pelagivirga sediminicola]
MTHEQGRLGGEYHGTQGPLFWLAVRTAMLTALTLGVYRFWAKTRIRRYVWSSVGADGDAFEYTGTGLEKFLGFLAAIVILAVYLGAVQMILFYFGLTLFGAAETQAELFLQFGAFGITSLAILPLVFFAQYRARRYRLARTRWRGLRFGAEAAAWGYVWRAMIYWAIALLSLGLLWPLMTFRLAQYKADRSWYGNARFRQNGRWTGLYAAMKQLFVALGLMVLAAIFAAIQLYVLAGLWATLGAIWFSVGLLSYRVNAFVYLTENLVLEVPGADDVTFGTSPQTWNVLWQMVGGSMAVFAATGLVFGLLGAGPLLLIGLEAVPLHVLIVPSVLLYMLALAISGALWLIWVAQPILRHVVTRCTAQGTGALNGVAQRAGDSGADAEGFADALDIGGAF